MWKTPCFQQVLRLLASGALPVEKSAYFDAYFSFRGDENCVTSPAGGRIFLANRPKKLDYWGKSLSKNVARLKAADFFVKKPQKAFGIIFRLRGILFLLTK